MEKRRKFGKEFKAKVALAALKGDKTMAELSSLYGVHSSLITKWAKQAREQLSDVFADNNKKNHDNNKLIEKLYQRIGQLSVECEWFKKKLGL
jgi:transposase-like protein